MDFPFPSRKPARLTPRITTPFALGFAALFMALLFTGCARHDHGGAAATGGSLNVPARHSASEEVKKATPVAEAEVEDNLEPSEGDIDLPDEIAALEKSGKWSKKDQEKLDMSKYDFPVVLNDPVKAYLQIFQGQQHEMFQRWLARSTKYIPMIKRELAKAGLPQDLAYLSMIESGYMPTARSSAGAVGLWQFMRDTGKHYTLRIDDYVDERRHIEKSTKAAVDMLGELYRDFGDWHLAVAAYNSGPARVQNGLSRFDVENFWDLADEDYLPWETKRYVPKLIAAIIIAKDPEKYGFYDVPYQAESNYDRLTVTPGLALDAVALVAGCSATTIKSMNPELRRGIVPPNTGRYVVQIPAGSKELANRNLALLHTVHDTKYRHHVVKRRENMAMVCKHYGISRATLVKANNLNSERLTPGRTLRIPYTVTSYTLGGKKTASVDDGDMVASTNVAMLSSRLAPPKTGKTKEAGAAPHSAKTDKTKGKSGHDDGIPNLYLVKNGETLSTIAHKHNVSPRQIRKWNNLKSNAIHAGLRLRLSEA